MTNRTSPRPLRSVISRALPLAPGGVLAVALVIAAPSPGGASPPPRKGVATESRGASQVAIGVLQRGGTAVDAMIAAAFAAGVVAPTSSGIGGGGFAMVYRAADRSVTALDFRETAPAVLDAEAFEHRPLPDAERGKLVGVPGEVRGLAWLHEHFGKRAWSELVAPAERLARDGFPIETHMANVLGGKDSARYRLAPSVDRAFWPQGKLALLGQRVRRPELAKTLHTLGTQGPEAFYKGAIAEDIVQTARQFGSTLTTSDLARYEVRPLTPLRVAWEGYEVVTMPPPSAGGLLLAEVLGSFTRAELEQVGPETPLGVHLVAEAMRGALADRAQFIGDPGILPVDVARLLAPARLAARKAKISADHTQPMRGFFSEEHGTHAMVVADAEGNVISLTTTVNTAFGAKIAAETTGIVLNDELDDFTPRAATTANGIRFPPNVARPGCRPTSSMMPTIVLRDGRPVFALGGSGGYAIPPDVTETLLALLVRGKTPEEAVKAPRFRLDGRDFSLMLDAAFGDAMRDDLVHRGESARVLEFPTAVQALAFGPAGTAAGADPRKGGVALVQ